MAHHVAGPREVLGADMALGTVIGWCYAKDWVFLQAGHVLSSVRYLPLSVPLHPLAGTWAEAHIWGTMSSDAPCPWKATTVELTRTREQLRALILLRHPSKVTLVMLTIFFGR